MPEQDEKPEEIATLKCADSRYVSLATSAPRRDPFSSDDENSSPDSAAEHVAWPGKEGSWWRVNSTLTEDLIVRAAVSIASQEIRRISPGKLLQQSGAARAIAGGRAHGCIRLPIHPSGWVTGDASKAGGPKYLVRASAPRWRVVHSTPKADDPDAIVREDPTLDSDSVSVLHNGDIVEQAAPLLTRSDGIVRMMITSNITRKDDAESGEAANGRNTKNVKNLGWVTIDATAAGGPVFFKPLVDMDKDKRRRRPHQQWA